MDKVFAKAKEKSSIVILSSAIACLALAFIGVMIGISGYFVGGGEVNVGNILRWIVSSLLVKTIVAIILIKAVQSHNNRLLTMIVGLILVYLCISDFVNGTADVFSIGLEPTNFNSWLNFFLTLLAFAYGIISVLILVLLCLDFLSERTSRSYLAGKLLTINVCLSLVTLLIVLIQAIYLTAIVQNAASIGLSLFSDVAGKISNVCLLIATWAGFVALRVPTRSLPKDDHSASDTF